MDQKGRNEDEEAISGSGRSMHGYSLTYSWLYGENFTSSGSQQRGLNFCVSSTQLWDSDERLNAWCSHECNLPHVIAAHVPAH